MPRKTRFVAFDWSSSTSNAPDRIGFDTPHISQTGANSYAQSPDMPNSTGAPKVPLKETRGSDGSLSGSLLDDTQAMLDLRPLVNPLSLSRSSLTSLQLMNNPQPGSGKLTISSDRSVYPKSAEAHSPMHRGLSEDNFLVTLSSARIYQSPYLGPCASPSRPQDTSMARPASSPALPGRPTHMDKLWPRKPIQEVPVPGKIYFVPDGRYFPSSIIYAQKQQVGFFRHPIMILDVDSTIANFYAMTKEPPAAIRDLNMAMRLGTSAADEGPAVLRLAPGSDIMLQETWINLEQRFFIEWRNLDEWAVNVQVDAADFSKIASRVAELEAQQNRFIYKPLLRAMNGIQPGMVIMLPNQPGSATFGAPIIVVENDYPDFKYLRVKRFEDNINFNPAAKRAKGSERRMSLAITKTLRLGHDGTPVMLLEPESPAMREESYVEVHAHPQVGRLDTCRTWCWPPVCVNQMSMVILGNYMADAAAECHGYGYTGPVRPRGYHQPTQHAHWNHHTAMQQPGYGMRAAMLMPAYPAGNYMYGSSNVFQHHGGSGSGYNSM
ncbi:hypothetical protein HBI18_214080 [Parastagonospora nodorum]|nr:hypothetical protein HBI18_214080 [Parastagonospora nodorum]